MSRFRKGVGGDWLVCINIGSDEFVYSCKNYEDAEIRAVELAEGSPERTVTIYKAVERVVAAVSVVSRDKVEVNDE